MDDMGQANLANAVGSLDVDILLDEGPDTLNMMQDSYDALQALSNQGTQIPPAALIELSPLASSVKRKVLAILEQASAPSEFDQKVMGIKVQEAEGKARKVNAEATKIEGEAETSPMRDRAAAFRDVSSAASQIAKARQPQPLPSPACLIGSDDGHCRRTGERAARVAAGHWPGRYGAGP
jgi:hypothetical protein